MSNDRVTLHCNVCGRDTYHSVLFEKREPWNFYDVNAGDISGENRYEVLSCGGCDAKSFRHSSQHSENWDPETNGWENFVYPPRYSRPIPEWIDDLEPELGNVLRETYSALNNSQVFLAAFGLRTALDVAMTKLVGDLGDFGAKKKEMVNRNMITSDDDKLFEAIIETGHAAAHRGHQPTLKELNQLAEMLETLLHRLLIYPQHMKELASRADKITKAAPPRPPRPAKGSKGTEPQPAAQIPAQPASAALPPPTQSSSPLAQPVPTSPPLPAPGPAPAPQSAVGPRAGP